jgi:phage terminase large subunit GpA-like protein
MFSNPTTEKDAIDINWNKSDQKEWTITCSTCKAEQIMTWPESIDMAKKCFICKECKGGISDKDRRFGKWVAQRPNKKISGYHISLLMAPWVTAEEIAE